MSVDTTFRALLAGYSGLTALVGTRIALNAVPESSAYPLVVFVSGQQHELGLDNTLHGTAVTYSVQCFAESAAGADAVATQVKAAVATDLDYVITDEASGFDEDLGLDAVVLTVQTWVT